MTYKPGYGLTYKLSYWLTYKLGCWLTYKLGYWLTYKHGYWLTYTLGYWLTYKQGYYLTNTPRYNINNYITTNSNWKRSYRHRIQPKLQTNLPRYISSFNEWTPNYTVLVISGRLLTSWPTYVGHRHNGTFQYIYDWTVQLWCWGFGWGCTKRTLATRPG